MRLPPHLIRQESIFIQDTLELAYEGRRIPMNVSIMTFTYLLSDDGMPPLITYSLKDGWLTLTQYTYMTYAFVACWTSRDSSCQPRAFAPRLSLQHAEAWIPPDESLSYTTLPRLLIDGEKAWMKNPQDLMDSAYFGPLSGNVVVSRIRFALPQRPFRLDLPIMESAQLMRLGDGAYTISWTVHPSFFERHQEGILPRPCAEERTMTTTPFFGESLNPIPGLSEILRFSSRPRRVYMQYEACLRPQKQVRLE